MWVLGQHRPMYALLTKQLRPTNLVRRRQRPKALDLRGVWNRDVKEEGPGHVMGTESAVVALLSSIRRLRSWPRYTTRFRELGKSAIQCTHDRSAGIVKTGKLVQGRADSTTHP